MYKYYVFGLKVASEIPLKSDFIDFEEADVTIKMGKIPALETITLETRRSFGNQKEIVFNSEKSARFYFKEGKEVIVEPHPGVTTEMITQYLVGIGMSAVLSQRGLIPLHGSAIIYKEKCILIIGSSGAGKTSLSTCLLDKGGQMLTDDIISVQDQSGELKVYPSFSEQKLTNDLVDQFQLHEYSKGEIQYLSGPSGRHVIDRNNCFCNEPTSVDAVVMLRKTNDELSIERVTGVKKLDVLLKKVFRRKFSIMSETTAEIFKLCSKLANSAEVFLLSRPYGKLTMEDQIALIENALGGLDES